jgi:DNA-binding XRE family transcriptional regulator
MDYYSVFDRVTDAIKQQLREGRTQTELAKELNIHQTTIGKIARGDRILGRRTFDKIVKANPRWLREIIHG